MEDKFVKWFNTTGPCVPDKHYMLPVLPRLPGVDEMIDKESYFILHAPRQSGKTTFIKALTDKINKDGQRYALNCSLANLRNVTDKNEALTLIVSQLNESMLSSKLEIFKQKADTYDSLPGMTAPDRKVKRLLNHLCQDLDKPLLVFFDEADLLIGPGLLTFLAQIRDGFNNRDNETNKFPSSLALIGTRNIRDYLASENPDSLGQHLASPFNIVAERMTLANFTEREIGTLYRQRTLATGQVFEDSAIAKAWRWTEGQPWLVNALAKEVVTKQLNNDYSVTITKDHVDKAAEILIQGRDTHIDSLLERLKDPRVIKVMDGVFSGSISKVPYRRDDRQYCIDLGLVNEQENGALKPANQIYQEVISRVITDEVQHILNINLERQKWSDGKTLFISELLKEIQQFFRHNSDSFPLRNKDLTANKYDEATFSFMLLAYFQFAFNGSALIHRQFAEGRGSVDLSVLYHGKEYLVEAKLKENTTLPKSLNQIAGYLDKAGESEGWIVIFDRSQKKSWDEKIYWETQDYNGKTIHVVGC
ncbi:MAG: ATP-binding protein [Deltaproteobacteria bacterium]|jgi:hypothetical protein|nr:ATP-binding protein [Deltaproteobacteria bacterium]